MVETDSAPGDPNQRVARDPPPQRRVQSGKPGGLDLHTPLDTSDENGAQFVRGARKPLLVGPRDLGLPGQHLDNSGRVRAQRRDQVVPDPVAGHAPVEIGCVLPE